MASRRFARNFTDVLELARQRGSHATRLATVKSLLFDTYLQTTNEPSIVGPIRTLLELELRSTTERS